MASLGQLVVSLTAETAQFKEALSKAAYETDRAMKKIESSTSFVSTAFKTLCAITLSIGVFCAL